MNIIGCVPLPGQGLVARRGGLTALTDGAGHGPDVLLATLDAVANANGDGAALVLAGTRAALEHGGRPTWACAGLTADGEVAVLVHGAAMALVSADGAPEAEITDNGSMIPVVRTFAGSAFTVRLAIGIPAEPDYRLWLGEGTVYGGGVLLTVAHAAPAQSAAAQPAVAQPAVAQEAPAQSVAAQPTVAQSAAAQPAPAQEALAQDAMAQDAMAQEALAQAALAQAAVAYEENLQNAPASPSAPAVLPELDPVTAKTVLRHAGSAPAGSLLAGPAPASPEYASPEYPSAEYGNPEYMSPEYMSPEYMSPEYANPAPASPEYASPVPASPEYASPDYASPGYAATEYATPAPVSPEYEPTMLAGPAHPSVDLPPAGPAGLAGQAPFPDDPFASPAAGPAEQDQPAPASESWFRTDAQRVSGPTLRVPQQQDAAGADAAAEPPIVDLSTMELVQLGPVDPVLVDGAMCARMHFNAPDAPYCWECGMSMDEVQRNMQCQPRPPLGVLLVDDGRGFVLDRNYVIGREPVLDGEVASGRAAPLRISDPKGTVSRLHLRVSLNGWQVEVCDLGSANGSVLYRQGGQRTLAPLDAAVLDPGGRVGVGRRTVQYLPYGASHLGATPYGATS